VAALLAAIAVSCFFSACARDRGPARAERIILVTIDTLRADRLGCYGAGSRATPALDALARESILYEDVTAPAPITLVSHASILTGLTPPAHGVRANGSFRLPAGVNTLPALLKTEGFATAAFVGSFVLNREFGLDRGFDLYDDSMPPRPGNRKLLLDERPAAEVLARARAWLASRPREKFFLWIHLFDPHAPYRPPAPYDRTWADDPYAGEVAYVDAELGKFFGRLREMGIYDGALIVVTADHGEGLGEHGEKTHGLFAYQSTLHVPLIVRPPRGARAPVRVAAPVGLVDIAPSILAAAGLAPALPMEGRLLPRFPAAARTASPDPAGQAGTSVREIYFENLMPFHYFGWAGERGLRAGDRKLIRGVASELYDLGADARETNDLAAREPGEVTRLQARLEEAGAASVALAPGDAANAGLSDESLMRLRALGYVGASGARRRPAWGEGPDPRRMLAFFDAIDTAQQSMMEGKSDEAVAQLERLVRDGPPSVAALNLLGQERMARGETDAALKVLVAARSLDPGDYEIRRRLAEALYAKGDFQGALAEGLAAVRLNDRNAEGRSICGAALARLGRHDEAIAMFREAIAGRPRDPALHFNLGLALERAGRRADAESEYQRAVDLDPGAVGARVALAKALLGRGDVAGALGQATAAGRIAPDAPDVLEQLAIALARSGDAAGALARFDRLAALDPGRIEVHFDRGLVLETLGRRGEAAEAFRRFLSGWKGDPSMADAARKHLDRLGT
jgi:choline-sulfatase